MLDARTYRAMERASRLRVRQKGLRAVRGTVS